MPMGQGPAAAEIGKTAVAEQKGEGVGAAKKGQTAVAERHFEPSHCRLAFFVGRIAILLLDTGQDIADSWESSG